MQQKNQSNDVWLLRYGKQDMIFCHFRPLTQKLKFGKNVKNAWRYYPFTHYMCTINQDHMMYGSWDIKCKGQRLCHYGPFFALWPSQQPKKSKLKKKKAWRYYYFTLVYHKWWSYDVWFLRYQARQTEFSIILGYFLSFYSPNNPENQNFEKMKKIPGILSFYTWVP